MKRIQKKEELIRENLGLEKLRSLEGILSQGGMPVTDLSSVDHKNVLAKNYILNAKANWLLETPLPAEGKAGAGKPLPF